MKTVSTDLFKLIKSLTKQEKRYFKLQASRHVIGKENRYLQLFNAIDAQSEYDEEQIRKKFAGATFIKQLHVAKNYLYRLILSTLRQYGERNLEDDFPLQMRNVQILHDKGLFHQSNKILNRLKKRAQAKEQFLQLLEIYRWERHTIHQRNDHQGLEQYVNVGFQAEIETLDIYRNFLEFQVVQDRIFIPYWKKGQIRNEEEQKQLEELLEEELYRDEGKARSYGAKKFFHVARFTYYFLIGQYEICYEHIRRLVAMFEAQGGKGRENSHYIRSIINLYAVQKHLHKYEEALDTLKKLRQIPAASNARRAWLLVRSLNLEVDIFLVLGRFSEGVLHWQKFEDDLIPYQKSIDQQQRLVLYYHLAYLHFAAEHFEKSLHWINLLLHDPDLNKYEDFLCFGRILHLLIHYELHNDQLLESIVQSTYRFLSRRQRLYKVESIMLSLLKKYPNWLSAADLNQGFEEMHRDLLALENDEYERRAFEYFDFISWLESKIHHRSFEAVVQQKKNSS